MKFIVQDTLSIKKVLIFGSFGLCKFQHKVGMNSFPMRMNVISYGTNSFPWGMYSFRSKIPIVCFATLSLWHFLDLVFRAIFSKFGQNTGFVKYPKEKVKKQKNLSYVRPPKKFQPFLSHFWPFLPYFTWKIGHISKNPNSAIWPKPDSDSYW